MNTEEIKQQIIDAIANGKIQATTINVGDHVEHMYVHKIEKVEAGGVGFQFITPDVVKLTEEIQSNDVTPVQDNPSAPAQLCPYIQADKLNEIGVYTPEQFNDLVAKEAKKSAPKFADFLHKHQKTGYLHFGKDNKQHVFDTLRAYYPTMKDYSYGNFALYF